MKRKLLLAIMAFVFTGAHAFENIETEIVLYCSEKNVKKESEIIKRAPARIPQAAIVDGSLIITSAYAIENAHVSVVNENNEVVLDEYITLSSAGSYIQIPYFLPSGTYTLRIEYNEMYLYGYFYL